MITSGDVCNATEIPSVPLPTSATTSKLSSNSTSCLMPRRINGWSSINKTFSFSCIISPLVEKVHFKKHSIL